MGEDRPIDHERIRARQKHEDNNVFARLTPVYAAQRMQAQKFLQLGGGLSIVEWRTLWDLHEVGPATIRDLATIQHTDHSLLSRALPAMRDKGLVTLTRGKADGRQLIVALTDAGRAAYDTAAPVMSRRRAALRQTFTEDEISTFVSILNRLEEFLRLPPEDIIKAEKTQ